MRSELPPLVWLRAFEAAARHLSFTDAARELNLTQAAVSKHVKSLELHLRHALFIRRTRSLHLTKLGEAYVPKVRDAFERLAIGTREVFGGRRPQELTIRCAVSFAVNWLAPRLPSFLGKYPGKQIRILSSVWNEVLDADTYDLDIQYGLEHPARYAQSSSFVGNDHATLCPITCCAIEDPPRTCSSTDCFTSLAIRRDGAHGFRQPAQSLSIPGKACSLIRPSLHLRLLQMG